MSILETKNYSVLKDGVYDVKLLKYTEVDNDKGGYLELKWKFLNDGRIVTDNKFNPGYNIIANQYKKLIGAEDKTLTLNEIYDLMSKEESIKIEVSHQISCNKQGVMQEFTNINIYNPEEMTVYKK